MTDAAPRLETGSTAPPFTLHDQDGTAVSLADQAGSKVIVYFYPAASTPGCTTQACDFRDNINSLKSAGYRVLGVSKDAPDALRRFRDEQGRLRRLGREVDVRQDGHGNHPFDVRGR